MAKYKSAAEAVKDINSRKKVKIVGNKAGHGFSMGVLTDIANCIQSGSNVCVYLVTGTAYTVQLADIEPVSAETKAEIQENIKKLEAEIAINKSKLKFIEETGSEVFDETEFKVFQTLQTLKGKKSDIEKAKAIAKLINQ